jgi:transmembrane sensor
MRKRSSRRDVASMTTDEAAAYWFVRHDVGLMSAAENIHFQEWLGASAANRRAYEQTSDMWARFEAATDSHELRTCRAAALAVGRAARLWPRVTALAASIILVLGAAQALYRYGLAHLPGARSDASLLLTATHYATSHQQRSTITLADGTRVTLNLDTALDIDFSSGKRLVRLVRGQAFFEVAKDPVHSFIVCAADRAIEALGTQFDVLLDSNRVRVVLVEGRVRVNRHDGPTLDRIIPGKNLVYLAPGERLVASVGEESTVAPTNAMLATSWRAGWIAFQDESLERVIAELNRYSDRPLVAGDEGVKRLRLSGVFRIGDPDRFVAVIQELLPVRVGPSSGTELRLVLKAQPEPLEP